MQPATTHVRRYAKPSAPFLGADGRLQAIFAGHAATRRPSCYFASNAATGEQRTILRRRTATASANRNYKQTFGEGMYAQGAPPRVVKAAHLYL